MSRGIPARSTPPLPWSPEAAKFAFPFATMAAACRWLALDSAAWV